MLAEYDVKTITLAFSDLTAAITNYLQNNNVLVAGSSMDIELLVSNLSGLAAVAPVMTITLTALAE